MSTALQQQPGGRAADERAFQALFSVAAGGGGSGDGEEEGGGDGPWGVVGAVLGEAVLWQRYVHVRASLFATYSFDELLVRGLGLSSMRTLGLVLPSSPASLVASAAVRGVCFGA